jgi:NAD(P)-dependent dehydrogenase (short-subunit alcohol dehydrogenase family)
LAVELAKYHVRVNALLPGWTDTDLLGPARGWQKFIDNTIGRTAAGRWADPAEFANVAVFLADPSLTFTRATQWWSMGATPSFDRSALS